MFPCNERYAVWVATQELEIEQVKQSFTDEPDDDSAGGGGGGGKVCFQCRNSIKKSTGRTHISNLYHILHDPNVDMASLDMKNIMEPSGIRVSPHSPLHALEMCEFCLNLTCDTHHVVLSSQPKTKCQWCRCSFTRQHSAFEDFLCQTCTDGVIKRERDHDKDAEFLNRGLRPLLSLLGIIGGGGSPVRRKTDDVDFTASFGPLHIAIENDTGHSGKSPERSKDKKNIDALRKLNADGRFCVHFRIKPMKPCIDINKKKKVDDYDDDVLDDDDDDDDLVDDRKVRFDPLARWLVLRDLIVMLYRMFEKNVFLVDEAGNQIHHPIFYLFYPPNSLLIDDERKPFVVCKAVALPGTLVDAESRLFPDWACMMDPLMPHYSRERQDGQTFAAMLLFLKDRVPLDALDRCRRSD